MQIPQREDELRIRWPGWLSRSGSLPVPPQFPVSFNTLPLVVPVSSQLLCAGLAGWLLKAFNWPVPWLLGPMLVGILWALLQTESQPIPKIFPLYAKAVIGLATAARFAPEAIATASSHAIPLLLCIVTTGMLSLGYGYLFGRWAGIDRTTGFLAFVPGAASSIVAIGEEMGADAATLALLQYLRVLLVVMVVPSLVSFFFPGQTENFIVSSPIATATTVPEQGNFALIGLAICCLSGLWLGERLRLPASNFLGPFLIVLGLNAWLSQPLQVPGWLFALALTAYGLSVGLKFNWHVVQKLSKAVLIETVLVLALIFCCMGIAYTFHTATHVDTLTAILGLTPGGIEAMIATVMQLGGDTGLVMAMQMSRMLLIILVAPWLTSGLATLGARLDASESKE